MQIFYNLAVSMCLLTLCAVNVATNPFLPQASAQESPCEGSAPCQDATCCESCGCWVCP